MLESQDNQPSYQAEGERESIWSIARRLRNWYAWIFSVEYLIFLGLTIWDEVHYQTGDNALQTVLAVRRGMTANILDIAASAYVVLEGVMLAQWLKERDQRKEREAIEKAERAVQEAERAERAAEQAVQTAQMAEQAAEQAAQQVVQQVAEQVAEERQRWLAWYERMQEAQRAGQPFTEPPPTSPGSPSQNGR